MKNTRNAMITAITALGLLVASTSQAATVTWDDGGSPNENWSTGTNWAAPEVSPVSGEDSVELTNRNVLDYDFTVANSQSVTDTVGNNWLGLANNAWTGDAAVTLTLASGGLINVGALAPRGNNATVGPTFVIQDGASLTTVSGPSGARDMNTTWEAGSSSVTTWNTTGINVSLTALTVDLTSFSASPGGILTLVDYGTLSGSPFASINVFDGGGTLTGGGVDYDIDYAYDLGGGDLGIVITGLEVQVPEPSTLALLGAGGAMLMAARRRKVRA